MLRERLQTLVDLLANPSENIALVGVTIAIIVVLVIILALLLVAMALPGRGPATEADAPEDASRRAARRRSRAIAAVVVALGAVAASALWYDMTSSPEYCTSTCHAMAEPTEEWHASAHASVSCTRCHEGRPWMSFPRAAVGRTYSLYLHLSGAQARVRPVPERICMDCHEGIAELEIRTLSGELYVHREDLENGRPCISCHGPQGHVPPLRR